VLVLASANGPAQTPKPDNKAAPAAKAPPPKMTWTVYNSPKGKGEWFQFGVYSTEESAKEVTDNLAESGWDTKVEKATAVARPVPRVLPRAPSPRLPKLDTVTLERCTQVFNWLADEKDIAFKYPTDGCYARAQIMCQRMIGKKFRPRKIWSVGNGESLYCKTTNVPRGFVTWGYHVAPILRVRLDDAAKSQRWYVLDPSIFKKPATVQEWERAQMRRANGPKPYLTLSRVGTPPVWVNNKKLPGTGYWPGADPPGGPDVHAALTMKKYKPFEGKQPPKKFGFLHRGGQRHPSAYVALLLPREALPGSRPWLRKRAGRAA
jgi:hypothetical protein